MNASGDAVCVFCQMRIGNDNCKWYSIIFFSNVVACEDLLWESGWVGVGVDKCFL